MDEPTKGQDEYKTQLLKTLDNLTKARKIRDAQAAGAYQRLVRYEDVFQDETSKYNGTPTELITDNWDSREWNGLNYRPSNKMLLLIRQEIKSTLKQGIIREANTKFVNPSLARIKGNGKLGLCIDPPFLNKIPKNNWNEPPSLDRIITSNKDSQFSTALNFNNRFWQIPIIESSTRLCGFQIEGTVYEYLRSRHL